MGQNQHSENGYFPICKFCYQISNHRHPPKSIIAGFRKKSSVPLDFLVLVCYYDMLCKSITIVICIIIINNKEGIDYEFEH